DTTQDGDVFTVTFDGNLRGLNQTTLVPVQVTPGPGSTLSVEVSTRVNGTQGSDLTLVGRGQLGLAAASTFVGSAFVDEGVLVVQNSQSLGDDGLPEVQQINVAGPSGEFQLTFNGASTPAPGSPGALPFNATAQQVQDALNALPTIGGL